MQKKDHGDAYDGLIPDLENLNATLKPLIEGQIRAAEIDFHNITGRVKKKSSFLEKIRRKSYENPLDSMTDLCGIRIITFFPDQVQEIAKLLRSTFSIDEDNSTDKNLDLGLKEVGYQSVHLVASLGLSRGKLPEYKSISKIKFEIQIRTVLQHAWAELAHDGSYKFSGELPPKLQRRLNLASGALELIDEQLEEISKNIREHEKDLKKSAKSRKNEGINALSFERFYLDTIPKENVNDAYSVKGFRQETAELKSFGFTNLEQLYDIVDNDLLKHWSQEVSNTPLGIARDLMLYADIDKYFQDVYKNKWQVVDQPTVDFLSKKWGSDKVSDILVNYEIEIEKDEDTEDSY